MKRVLSFLLRLYPQSHQALFGAEMKAILEKSEEDQRIQGRSLLIFGIRELAGLLKAIGGEWIAVLCRRERTAANPQATGAKNISFPKNER